MKIFNSFKETFSVDNSSISGSKINNLSTLTESEKSLLIEDMKTFLSTQTQDGAQSFKLRDICKVPIFKLIAPIVDESKLTISELTD